MNEKQLDDDSLQPTWVQMLQCDHDQMNSIKIEGHKSFSLSPQCNHTGVQNVYYSFLSEC